MTSRLAIPLLLIVALASAATAQTTAAPAGSGDISSNIASLGSLDYPVRTKAARLLRRAPQNVVVPALEAAVRNDQADEYVRYRAFVLLTAFDDPGTPALVRDILHDRNDRVRETAYKWLDQHPDPQLANALLGTLQTEQAEFVRPALIDALAALGSDVQVQRALIGEIDRGLDLFRSAVIDALGRHKATYAVPAIAAIAHAEGPLQGDAILALGRIGGDTAAAALADPGSIPGDLAPTLSAARCLVGVSCTDAIDSLRSAAGSPRATRAAAQAAIDALGDAAEGGHDDALNAIVQISDTQPLHDAAAVAVGAVSIRRPEQVLAWLGMLPDAPRAKALGLLKDGFDSLEEDFGKEQFFAATRAAYWKAPDGAPTRALTASIIERLEF